MAAAEDVAEAEGQVVKHICALLAECPEGILAAQIGEALNGSDARDTVRKSYGTGWLRKILDSVPEVEGFTSPHGGAMSWRLNARQRGGSDADTRKRQPHHASAVSDNETIDEVSDHEDGRGWPSAWKAEEFPASHCVVEGQDDVGDGSNSGRCLRLLLDFIDANRGTVRSSDVQRLFEEHPAALGALCGEKLRSFCDIHPELKYIPPATHGGPAIIRRSGSAKHQGPATSSSSTCDPWLGGSDPWKPTMTHAHPVARKADGGSSPRQKGSSDPGQPPSDPWAGGQDPWARMTAADNLKYRRADGAESKAWREKKPAASTQWADPTPTWSSWAVADAAAESHWGSAGADQKAQGSDAWAGKPEAWAGSSSANVDWSGNAWDEHDLWHDQGSGGADWQSGEPEAKLKKPDLHPLTSQEQIDLDHLAKWLPAACKEELMTQVSETEELLRSIILDVGACPRAFFGSRWKMLSAEKTTKSEVDRMLGDLEGPGVSGSCFRGLSDTLHRVAPMSTGSGCIGGFTVHVRRAHVGIAHQLCEVLGRPGHLVIVGPRSSGKTSLLRDAVRVRARRPDGHVLVVDPDGELGGLGATAHASLGMARRVAWSEGCSPTVDYLASLAEDHLPETIAIDEPMKLFGTDSAQILAACPSSARLLCTARGSLQEMVLDDAAGGRAGACAGLLEHFGAAILLASEAFGTFELIEDLPSALASIKRGESYDRTVVKVP